MMNFNFNHGNDDTLMVRMSKETAGKVRDIAQEERVTIQEACRTLLAAAVEAYLEQKKSKKGLLHAKDN